MSQNEIALFACPHPFKTERIERKILQGSTVEQMLVDAGVSQFALTNLATYIYVNDRLIPRELWPVFIPEGGSTVTIRVAPTGGGGESGGKDPLRVVMTLAVIALSLWVPGLGVFGAEGALAGWGGIAGFGIAVGGMLAINALIPPQSPKVNKYNNTQLYSITGSQNQADPWGPCLKIFGKRRVYPRIAALPYTELVGSDQYLRLLFDVGYAPLELSSHKIGETDITSYDDVEYDIYQNDEYLHTDPDDEQFSLYPYDVYEQSLSIELTQSGGWQQQTTQANIDEIGFDLTFPSGLWHYSDDRRQSTTVRFEVQYAVKDSEQWVNFDDDTYQYLDLASRPTPTISVGDTVSQAASGAQGTIKKVKYKGETYDTGEDDGDGRSKYGHRKWADNVNVALTTGSFVYPGTVTITSRGTFTLESVNTPRLLITKKADNLYREGFSIPVPNGQYDIRWRRTTDDHSSSSYADDSYVTALRSISYTNPVNLPGRCLVAMRIKATGQLSGMVDQYNCIAEALLPAHDGSNWNVVKTRSPAWAFTDVLRGNANHRAIADSKVDIAKFRAWDLRCETAGRYFDSVIDSQFTVFELLTNIAATGRATPGLQDNKYTVVEDLEQTVPVQHFTSRNSWNFTGSKLFPDQPHAFRCRFENEDSNYQADELVVCDDGYYNTIPTSASTWQASTAYATSDYCTATPDDGFYYRATNSGTSAATQPTWPAEIAATIADNNITWICEDQATRFETMDFWGYVDSDHVWKDARYMIACARLRPEVFTFDTDVEHVVCTRGDMIRLSHDVLSIGLAQARITAITTTGGGDVSAVSLDNTVTMATGTNYGVRIRKSNGVSITATVVTDPGEQKYIEFSPDISAATAPSVGDLLMFGELNNESIECVVTRIEPGPDLSAKITCVHAAPAVHDADTDVIPAFDTNITHLPEINRVPPTPDITDWRFDTHWVDRRDDESYRIVMHVAFEIPTQTTSNVEVQGFQAQWKEDDGEWKTLPTLESWARTFEFYVANGATYDIRVRSFASKSNWSDWDLEEDITVSLATLQPPSVTGLQVKGGGTTFTKGDCEIEWTGPTLGGTAGSKLKHYMVQVRKTDETVLRTEYVTDASYVYTLAKNQQDNSGTPISSIKFYVWTVNMWDQVSESATIMTATNSAPTNPQNLTATSQLGGVQFNWDSSTESDFSHFVYRLKVGDGSWSHPATPSTGWYRTTSTRIERRLTDTEKGTYGGTATIYIEVQTVDVLLSTSSTSSTNAACETFAIQETDIDDFAKIASNYYTTVPVVQGLSLTDNSPSTGSVAWSSCSIYYDGTEYSVASGNTGGSDRYIYWKDQAASLSHSSTHPATGDWVPGEDFIIAVNDNGIGQLAWNAIANQMIGSAWILNGSIGNAKISDLDAGKINAGYLSAARIESGSITVSLMSADVTGRIFTTSTKRTNIEAGYIEVIGSENSINLLNNGGFEETDGNDDAYWWTTASYISTATDGGEDSNNYLSITRDSGTDRLAYQLDDTGATRYFEVNEGEVYEFGGDLRSSGAPTARMVLTYCDKDKGVVGNVLVATTGMSFTSMRDTHIVASGTKYIRISVSTVSANGICDFDNLFLRKLDFRSSLGLDDDGYVKIPVSSDNIGSAVTAGQSAVVMSSSGLYGFNGSSNNTFYLKTDGTFKVGGTNDYFQWDGSKVVVSTANTDGMVLESGGSFRIKSGGDLNMDGGGDINMTPHDTPANASRIVLKDSGAGTYHVEMARDTTYDRVFIWPQTDNTCQFYIGHSDSPAQRFTETRMYSTTGGSIEVWTTGGHKAQMSLGSGTTGQITCQYSGGVLSGIGMSSAASSGFVTLYGNYFVFNTTCTATAAGNDSFYVSTSSGKLRFKDSGGSSHDLY